MLCLFGLLVARENLLNRSFVTLRLLAACIQSISRQGFDLFAITVALGNHIFVSNLDVTAESVFSGALAEKY